MTETRNSSHVNTWTKLRSTDMRIRDKVANSVSVKLARRQRMIFNVRQAYEDGRWASATPAQRAHTRRNFQILNTEIKRLVIWLEEN